MAQHVPPPTTLKEAFAALDLLLSDSDKAQLKTMTPTEGAVIVHSSLGRRMRNEWGLWHHGPLVHVLQLEHGLNHPDDMSHFVLVQYLTQLNDGAAQAREGEGGKPGGPIGSLREGPPTSPRS